MNDREEQREEALESIAAALRRLGTNDAATQMGAIEHLAKEIKEGCEAIAGAVHDLAEAIRERE